MAPMSSQTTSSQNGEPSECGMPAGVRKIPTAMTSPTTRAVTDARPSWRVSGTGDKAPRRTETGQGLKLSSHRFCETYRFPATVWESYHASGAIDVLPPVTPLGPGRFFGHLPRTPRRESPRFPHLLRADDGDPRPRGRDGAAGRPPAADGEAAAGDRAVPAGGHRLRRKCAAHGCPDHGRSAAGRRDRVGDPR